MGGVIAQELKGKISRLDAAAVVAKGDLKVALEAQAAEARKELRGTKPLPAQFQACTDAIARSEKRLAEKQTALIKARDAVRDERETLKNYRSELSDIQKAFAEAGQDPHGNIPRDGADVHILSDGEDMEDEDDEETYEDSPWQRWPSSWDNWDGYGVSSEPAPPSSCPTTASRSEDPRLSQLEGVVMNLSTKFDQLLAHLGPGGTATPAAAAPATPAAAAPVSPAPAVAAVAVAAAPVTSPAGTGERSGSRSPRGRARDRAASAAPPRTTGRATAAFRRASGEDTPP